MKYRCRNCQHIIEAKEGGIVPTEGAICPKCGMQGGLEPLPDTAPESGKAGKGGKFGKLGEGVFRSLFDKTQKAALEIGAHAVKKAEAERLIGSVGKMEADYKQQKNTEILRRGATLFQDVKSLDEEDERGTAEFRGFRSEYRALFMNLVGAAHANRDKEGIALLKTAAQQYDKDLKAFSADEGALYFTLLQAYPDLRTAKEDWAELIAGAKDESALQGTFMDGLIAYLVDKKDRNFTIEVFMTIAAKKERWAETGRIYLIRVLGNSDMAKDFFAPACFKDAAARRFIHAVERYRSDYLPEGLNLEGYPVYQNYQIYRRGRKKRSMVAGSICLVVAIAAFFGISAWGTAVKKGSVYFDIPAIINVEYGHDPDFSEGRIEYENNFGVEKHAALTLSRVRGFNAEQLGEQEVTVSFGGKEYRFKIFVKAATLATPVIRQNGNFVTWEQVPNAETYSVYINSQTATNIEISEHSYDLSLDGNSGTLKIMVRARTTDERYAESAMSEQLTVTKLAAPSDLVYRDGVLTWRSVEGADHYELTVNGNVYTTKETNYEVALVRGGNHVKIVAVGEKNIVNGVLDTAFDYTRMDPVKSISYLKGRISWEGDAEATSYTVTVDGEPWNKFTGRNYFDIAADDFPAGSGEHTIGIVCNSDRAGAESSDETLFRVYIGNPIRFDREHAKLTWDAVDANGVTYEARLGGNVYSGNKPELLFSDFEHVLSVGENIMTLTVKSGEKTIVCEGVTLTKLDLPKVSLKDGNWETPDGAANRYRLDEGEWETQPPKLEEIEGGKRTLEVKRAAEKEFEFDSEILELHIRKAAKPTIRLQEQKIVSSNTDPDFSLQLYCSASPSSEGSKIGGLEEIETAGKYYIRAKLIASDTIGEGELVIDSDLSDPIEVVKLAAPTVDYSDGEAKVTADGGNVKFYYMDGDTERELEGGNVQALPKGIFEVYARRLATPGSNELDSVNSDTVPIVNMSIKLDISPATATELYALFSGCEDIDSLTFTYELIYRDKNKNKVASKTRSYECHASQVPGRTDEYFYTIDYKTNIKYEDGRSESDIDTVQLVVTIVSGGQDGVSPRPLTASMKY